MTPDERILAVQARALHDAWLEGSRRYWERRARQFEAARPKRGDFNGNATPAELAERHHRLTEAAAACRNRASGLDGVAINDLANTAHDVAANTPGAAA